LDYFIAKHHAKSPRHPSKLPEILEATTPGGRDINVKDCASTEIDHQSPILPSSFGPSIKTTLNVCPVLPTSKAKVVGTSAIRNALEENKDKPVPSGILRYLTQCSPDEYQDQIRRDTAESQAYWEQHKEATTKHEKEKQEHVREQYRLRQQRHRQRQYDREIGQGLRSPGGTKRMRKVSPSCHIPCDFEKTLNVVPDHTGLLGRPC
jgi:hypothetical protein